MHSPTNTHEPGTEGGGEEASAQHEGDPWCHCTLLGAAKHQEVVHKRIQEAREGTEMIVNGRCVPYGTFQCEYMSTPLLSHAFGRRTAGRMNGPHIISGCSFGAESAGAKSLGARQVVCQPKSQQDLQDNMGEEGGGKDIPMKIKFDTDLTWDEIGEQDEDAVL